jgi:molecular chaperone DnaJ
LFTGRRGPRKGQDIETEISISFRDALFGKEVDLRLSGQSRAGSTITVRIPAGVSDGSKVRVKGRGGPGEAGPGDLFVLVNVIPHPVFTRKAENLHISVPVSFTEAALGADIAVPTIEGDEVIVRLGSGTQNGKTLRVKGRGVKKGINVGDLLVTIEVQVPERIDGKAKKALEEFATATKGEDLRSEFMQRARA